ncbi:hypothetical protein CW304_23930 [Bacillus sp. UFRGS-B20]|nr:hypothetical protein CW304_23930 [Bacillus sp. UFRGS-B20]
MCVFTVSVALAQFSIYAVTPHLIIFLHAQAYLNLIFSCKNLLSLALLAASLLLFGLAIYFAKGKKRNSN